MLNKFRVDLKNEYGVLFNRYRNFSRFLRPGRHFIFPYREHLEFTIPMQRQEIAQLFPKLRLSGGMQIAVAYKVHFYVDPFLAPSNINTARVLILEEPYELIIDFMEYRLPKIFGNEQRQELTNNRNRLNTIELKLSEILTHEFSNLGFQNFSPRDVRLFVELPEKIEDALKTKEEKDILIEIFARKLKRIHSINNPSARLQYLPEDYSALVRILDEKYNKADLILLCLKLKTDYENLRIESLSKKAQITALVLELHAQNKISELVKIVKHDRPNSVKELEKLKLD